MLKVLLVEGELSNFLNHHYIEHEKKGCFSIVGHIFRENTSFKLRVLDESSINNLSFNFIIVSSTNFLAYKLLLKKFLPNIKDDIILDGRIFTINGLDFNNFINDRKVIYSNMQIVDMEISSIKEMFPLVIPRFYSNRIFKVLIGRKSYARGLKLIGRGEVTIENYTGIATEIVFEMGLNNHHNWRAITNYDIYNFDFHVDKMFDIPQGKIKIGSDVWIGNSVHLKAPNDRPLIISDGAVIAGDSVVIKDVPPYAIVGGNPAKIIRYRFEKDVIDKLLQIRWWEWDEEKIFMYHKLLFNPDEFIKRFG